MGIATGGGGGGTHTRVGGLGGQQTPVAGQQRIAGLSFFSEQQQPWQGLLGVQGQAALGVLVGTETFLNSRLIYGILLRTGQSLFGAFSGAGFSPRDTPTIRVDRS